MSEWSPPAKIESLYLTTSGSLFGAINAPTAGARQKKEASVGKAPFQLYSLATPNGQKVGIMLEELGIEYDAWTVNIGKGQQFDSYFVEINPNSKIPCGVDQQPADGKGPINLFESGSMLLYLADKYQRFVPSDPRQRAECMNWVMWQMAGQGPMTGNFGHFMVYAPPNEVATRNYGVARYGMEVQRLCDVLNRHLSSRKYMCGEDYTIADIAILPWFHQIRVPEGYRHKSGIAAKDILSISKYEHVNRWADALMQRPTVQRGMLVCRGASKPWLTDDRFKHLSKL